MINNISVDVVIPAAGVGKRMQSSIPKQYLKIGEKTILSHTVEKMLLLGDLVSNVYVVVSQTDEYIRDESFIQNPKVKLVDGGAERCYSVLNGIKASKSDYVLVHDAARPCVQLKDIKSLITENLDDNGGILVSRVCDTMKRTDSLNKIQETVERNNLYHALTPQFFRRELLIKAYEHALTNGLVLTDEASAMELLGYNPKAHISSAINIKITEPNDLKLAEIYMKEFAE